jgi:hypothetical protein
MGKGKGKNEGKDNKNTKKAAVLSLKEKRAAKVIKKAKKNDSSSI